MSFFRKFLMLMVVLLAAAGALYVIFPDDVANLAMNAERGRSHLTRREMDIPGFHVVYLEGGSGEPLLLLHGIGADKDNWTRTARWLTPHYRVIAVDLPGFGESSKPDTASYSIGEQVQNVAAIAQTLGLDHFSLGGNSMGGWIAGSYAAAHSDQIASLWLLDPGGVAGAKPSEMMKRINAGEPVPLFARTPEEFNNLLHFVFVHPPYVPGAILNHLAQVQTRNYDLNVRIFGQLRRDFESAPLEKIVEGLNTPTLVVWGGSDRALDVSSAEILHKALPSSQVSIMPDIGHLPMMEAPEAAAVNYLRFRDAVAAGTLAQATSPE